MQNHFTRLEKKIIEGFKNGTFSLIKGDVHSDYEGPDSPGTSDSSINKSHGLTDKKLQMFKERFSQKKIEELNQV